MLPDRVSNPGPLTYESGALPIALRGPAVLVCGHVLCMGFDVCCTDAQLRRLYVSPFFLRCFHTLRLSTS